jgi:hypothetical protein
MGKDSGQAQKPKVARTPPADQFNGAAFVRVRKGYVLLSPFSGEPIRIAVAGDILRADDPCLDSSKLPEDIVKRFHLQPHDTRFRCEPAPEAKAHTIKVHDAVAKLYAAIGYQGYMSEAEKLRAAKLAGAAPAPRAGVRTAPSAPVGADDLSVPARDPVETE